MNSCGALGAGVNWCREAVEGSVCRIVSPPRRSVEWTEPHFPSANRHSTDDRGVSVGSADKHRSSALVTILMCTYNGCAHINEQLRSLAGQTHDNWQLVASDDGSTDDTVSRLIKFASQKGRDRVELRYGPRTRGISSAVVEPREHAARNYLSLVTDRTISGDYFAYCDQDDSWAADKLERALAWLSTVPDHVPALYGSRTRIVRETGEPYGLSPLFAKSPHFRNALVQSLAGGNTMVFNSAGRDLLAAAGNLRVASHDWWTYLLVTGGGGLVHYDRVPSINYRQHNQNLVGANQDLNAMLRRLELVMGGAWARWMDLNLMALRCSAHLLTPENRHLLEELMHRRSGSWAARLGILTRLGLFRQTSRGQLALGLAVVAGRL